MLGNRVDRLTLDDGGGPAVEVQGEEEEMTIPEEELLRLDDGTRLPVELAELRSLLQIHQAASSSAPPLDDAAGSDDPERATRLAALAAAKAEALTECLLEFDEGILLLHDKLLDHEALCKQLEAVRRRKRVVPAGKSRFDEACSFDDDDDDDGDNDGDGALDLNDLLSMDGPGGASAGAGAGRATAAATFDTQEHSEEENAAQDEEALDQRVVASRQQIKTWLRALEEGKRDPPKRGAGALAGALANGVLAGASAGPRSTLSAAGAGAVTGSLPPVRPPPRARQSSYSSRLRSQAATWNGKYR